MGSETKEPTASELPVRALVRRSVTTVRDIAAGAMLQLSDLTLLRPGTGIAPRERDRVPGKRARHAIPAGSTLQWYWTLDLASAQGNFATLQGSTWYTDGTKAKSGPAGTPIQAYGAGALQNVPYRLVLGTGLGILSDKGGTGVPKVVALATLRPELAARYRDGDMLIITKTNRLSTVHRRVRLDDSLRLDHAGDPGQPVHRQRQLRQHNGRHRPLAHWSVRHRQSHAAKRRGPHRLERRRPGNRRRGRW